MTFRLSWEQRPNKGGLDERVAVLSAGDVGRLEVWPALGFTALRWNVGDTELLYTPATFFDYLRPTRGGWPILFPFPNRIRAGWFTWAGLDYELPLGDPAKKNAIHGFACWAAWRVIDEGADDDSAWLTGEFQASKDAPHTLPLWPADGRLRVTYRLLHRGLRIEAAVDNPDTKALPFGLGYHPYFALAPFGGESATVTVPATQSWPLVENLPTGAIQPVAGPNDLRSGPAYSSLHLDDVLTGLQPTRVEDDLGLIGQLHNPAGGPTLDLWATRDFRDMVVFTPPHRQALCLEPYTCTTDAINLPGDRTGLRVLQPGEHWRGDVEMIYRATKRV